ncbi:MAG: hypothetical protein JW741_28880 [Sedimentisphaerales bacterium]|nr:hypothetical protein [Sedimentisphaerales bacterium]
MRSPIAKFAVAAAVIVAVLIGAALFRSSASGVVWAEVARKVQASRGVIFRSAEQIVPDTYDQENDYSMQYCTSTQSRLDGYKDGQIIKTIWGDCNTKTVILVDHLPSHRSYIKMTLEERMPDRLQTADPNRWVQKFLSCDYEKLGQKTIDGVLCEGIETTDPAFYGGGTPPETPVARLWVGVETGYPVQFEGERVYDDQRHTYIQDQFQWNVEIDESLFEPNIPEGYIDISPDQ